MNKDLLLEYCQGAVRFDQAGRNRAWRICTDGRAFTHHNPPGVFRPLEAEVYWFARPWPEAPARMLPKFQVDELRALLAGQAARPPHERLARPGAPGQSWFRLSMRTPGGPRVLEVDDAHYAELDALLRPVLAILKPPGA